MSVPLPYTESPLLHSLYLSELAGAQVFLKLENTQPSGSFKSRGLGNLVYQTICGNNPKAPLSAEIKNSGSGLPPPNYFHFFSPSGGNAGCATSYAARQYNQQCTVCLPKTANPIMVDRIRKAGANVVVHGDTIAESVEYIKQVLIPACTSVAVYCHPYNDELVWQGNSTIMDEMYKQLTGSKNSEESAVSTAAVDNIKAGLKKSVRPNIIPIPTPSASPTISLPVDLPPSPNSSTFSLSTPSTTPSSTTSTPPSSSSAPAAIICSVGGGGLYNGIVQGLVRHNWTSTNVIAVETEGCAALNLSIESVKNGGPSIQIAKPATIATSLATINVTDESIKYALGNGLVGKAGGNRGLHDERAESRAAVQSQQEQLFPTTHSLVISDKQAAQSCINFVHDHNMLIEAACGTALAPIYNRTIKQVLPDLKKDDKVVVVLCGGTAISFGILKEYADRFGIPF